MADDAAAGQYGLNVTEKSRPKVSQQTDHSKGAAERAGAPLEGQIDALLDGLERESDDAAAPEANEAAVETPAAESDDPLADQIQEMLDEAREKQEAALGDAAEVTAATTTEADAANELEQLDDELAAEADEYLDGDFESVHEVLGTTPDESAEPTPDIEAAAPAALETPALESEADAPESEAEADDEAMEIDGDFLDPTALHGEADVDEEADGETDLVAGDFEAPEEVTELQPVAALESEAATGGDFSATADDIADELDSETDIEGSFAGLDDIVEAPVRAARQNRTPEHAPAPTRAAADVAEPDPQPKQQNEPRIHVAAGILHKTCCVISKPISSVNDEWRNIIGYAGVVTLFNFSVLMLYKLASTLLG